MKKKTFSAYLLGTKVTAQHAFNRAYRSEGEEAKKQAELLAKVKEAGAEGFKEKAAELASKLTALEAKDAEASKLVEALKNNLALVEAELKAFKEKGGELSPLAKSIKSQITEQLEAKKADWENFKSKTSNGFGLKIKAATNMLESSNITSTGATNAYVPKPDIRPGYIDLVRNLPLIEQYANGGATSSALMVWVDKYNAQGTAAATAEGVSLPLVSTAIKTETTQAVLEGAYITVSLQMLNDIDFMAAMIEQELMYKVNIQVDNDLLSATGGANALNGILNYAVAFISTAIATSNPNNFDAIRAVIGQQRSLNFYPTHVFINPIDAANMDVVKDLYGRPIAQEYKQIGADGQETIFGLKKVESPQIAAGTFLVADMSKFFVFNYEAFEIQYGWVNDNLIKNLITITGQRRLHSFASLNHLNAFVTGSFATVKAAIAPTP